MTSPSRSRQPLVGLMVLLLWAPAAWIVYFWVVYLAAEVVCVGRPFGAAVDDGGLVAFVVAATVVAAIAVAGWLRWIRRSASGPAATRTARLIATLLVGCFVLAVLAVGVPALVLDPC